jgi:hypothetical protein
MNVQRETPSSLLTTYPKEACMRLFAKHIKCIRHEKPSKKRENLAPLLLTYIMPFLFVHSSLGFLATKLTSARFPSGFSQLLRSVIYLFFTSSLGRCFSFCLFCFDFFLFFCVFLCCNMNFLNNKSIVQQ